MNIVNLLVRLCYKQDPAEGPTNNRQERPLLSIFVIYNLCNYHILTNTNKHYNTSIYMFILIYIYIFIPKWSQMHDDLHSPHMLIFCAPSCHVTVSKSFASIPRVNTSSATPRAALALLRPTEGLGKPGFSLKSSASAKSLGVWFHVIHVDGSVKNNGI